MPRNTPTGVFISILSAALGFAMVWYIWWLAALSFAAILVVSIAHTFNYKWDFYIPVEDVVREEERRTQALAARN